MLDCEICICYPLRGGVSESVWSFTPPPENMNKQREEEIRILIKKVIAIVDESVTRGWDYSEEIEVVVEEFFNKHS